MADEQETPFFDAQEGGSDGPEGARCCRRARSAGASQRLRASASVLPCCAGDSSACAFAHGADAREGAQPTQLLTRRLCLCAPRARQRGAARRGGRRRWRSRRAFAAARSVSAPAADGASATLRLASRPQAPPADPDAAPPEEPHAAPPPPLPAGGLNDIYAAYGGLAAYQATTARRRCEPATLSRAHSALTHGCTRCFHPSPRQPRSNSTCWRSCFRLWPRAQLLLRPCTSTRSSTTASCSAASRAPRCAPVCARASTWGARVRCS